MLTYRRFPLNARGEQGPRGCCGTPGNVGQIKVFAAVLALGVRADHKLEEDGATASIPHLSVKFLFVCLSNVRNDGAGYFFPFATAPMGEISKIRFDLIFVSYIF